MEQKEKFIPYTIRKATPDDASLIIRISDISWENTYVNEELGITREAIKERCNKTLLGERIQKMKNRILALDWVNNGIWVAEAGSNPVGFIAPKIDENNKHRVGAVYLLPEYKRKGIGTALMNKVLELYAHKDIYLTCALYNKNAERFYLGLGFVDTGEISNSTFGNVTIPIKWMVRRCKENIK